MTQKNNDNFTFIEHLEILRKHLLYCIFYLLIATLLSFVFVDKLVQILKLPLSGLIDKLVFTHPTEIFTVYFKISLFSGLIISFPAILYNLWLFIKPAVEQEIKFNFLFLILIVFTFFIFGTYFAYKIFLPFSIKFLLNFGGDIAYPMVSLNNYISFVLSILIIMGIVFEMPVFCAILTKLGILQPKFLVKKRKEVIFGIITFSAIITPTTDIFNLILFVLPMIVLYEISILVSYVITRFFVNKGEKVYFYE